MTASWSLSLVLLAQWIAPLLGAPSTVPSDLSIRNWSDDMIAMAVGHHIVWSYPGPTPPPALESMISKGIVGGIILFKENVTPATPSQMAALQALYAKSPAYHGSPMLITTDQEGGKVRRLPGGPNQTERVIGDSVNPPAAAASAGLEAANELKAYGCNANLAPVADVFSSLGDFADRFGRSYSNNSQVAAECVRSFVHAQEDIGGILATVKHFPGLGTAPTLANTDETPVTLPAPLDERIRAVDYVPFKSAIAAGVDMIMPSWAIYPAFDAQYPAGISRKWLHGELRSRLGFNGVIISDALEAGALAPFDRPGVTNDYGHRAVLAMQAGQDVLLASAKNVTQGEVVVNTIVQALKDGKLNWLDFMASRIRVECMRRKLR